MGSTVDLLGVLPPLTALSAPLPSREKTHPETARENKKRHRKNLSSAEFAPLCAGVLVGRFHFANIFSNPLAVTPRATPSRWSALPTFWSRRHG